MSVVDSVLMVVFMGSFAWSCWWFASAIMNVAKEMKQKAEFDAEYWPRRYAEIEAQRQYRDIPSRLDKWQHEKALDELTAETERLGLYDTLTLDEALNICGIERG